MRDLIKKALILIIFAIVINCSILFAAEYEISDGHIVAYLNDSKVTGWYKDQGRDYYAERGELVLGFKTISGKKYFFYTSGPKFGEPAKGYVTIEYFEYYFNEQGELLESGTTPDGLETDEDGAVLDDAGNPVIKDAGYSETATQDQMSIFVARMNQWYINDKNKYAETTAKEIHTISDISDIVGEADGGILWNGAGQEKNPVGDTNSSQNEAIILTPDKINTGGVNIVGRKYVLPVLPKNVKVNGTHVTVIQGTDVNNIVETFKRKYIRETMSTFEKEMQIIQYLVETIDYDYDNYLNGTIPNESYNEYGALVKHVCVCSGYAAAFKVLCEACGIPAVIVSSQEMNHAWNQVNIDGRWYNVDVTWEDPIFNGSVKNGFGFKNLINNYINLTDEEMGKDHTWSGYNTCNATSFGKNKVTEYLKSLK